MVHETLNTLISTIAWSDIEYGIKKLSDQIDFPASGLILCGYGINHTNQTSKAKLPRITLIQGTECIKQLYEIEISLSRELNDSEKTAAIQWNNDFLDIWKNKMIDALEQEGMLIG